MEDAGNWRFMSLGIVCGIVKVSSRASGVAGQHLTPPVLLRLLQRDPHSGAKPKPSTPAATRPRTGQIPPSQRFEMLKGVQG